MMLKRSLVPILAMLALCLAASPALSQGGGETAEAIALEGTHFPVKLAPEELPQFTVVSNFFRRASLVRNHQHAYKQLLKDVGIKPGSQEADFFAGVTDQAIEVLNEPTVDGRLSGEAYMEHQYTALREKARKLGVVYRNLLLGLEEASISPELVRAYCEKTIRPEISVFSTEIDNSRYFETVSEFEKQLEDF